MAEETLAIRDQRTEKRFFVDNVFVDEYGPIVGPYGHAVYNVLIRHSRPDGRGSWPSHATIAKKAGCGVAKVKKVLKQFDELGLVAIRKRWSAKTNGQTSNEYIILDPPALPQPPVTTDTPGGYTADTPTQVSQKATNNPPSYQSSPINPKPTPKAEEPIPEPDIPLPGTVEPWRGPPPPAARVFQSRMNRWPRRTSYRRIHDTVGDQAEDLEFWGAVVSKYNDLNWNPGNVDGMLEWYEKRKLPAVSRRGGNGKGEQNKRIIDGWMSGWQPAEPAIEAEYTITGEVL